MVRLQQKNQRQRRRQKRFCLTTMMMMEMMVTCLLFQSPHLQKMKKSDFSVVAEFSNK